MKQQALAVGAAAALALSACSSEQLYGAGQAWKQQECSKFAEAQQRQRCMGNMDRSYDHYEREAGAAKGS